MTRKRLRESLGTVTRYACFSAISKYASLDSLLNIMVFVRAYMYLLGVMFAEVVSEAVYTSMITRCRQPRSKNIPF